MSVGSFTIGSSPEISLGQSLNSSTQKPTQWQLLLDLIFFEAMAAFNHDKKLDEKFDFNIETVFFDSLPPEKADALEKITQIANKKLEAPNKEIQEIGLHPIIPPITKQNITNRFATFLSTNIIMTPLSEEETLWIEDQIKRLHDPNQSITFKSFQDFTLYITQQLSFMRKESQEIQGNAPDLKFYSPKAIKFYCRELILKESRKKLKWGLVTPKDKSYILSLYARFNREAKNLASISRWISEEIFLHRFCTEKNPKNILNYHSSSIRNLLEKERDQRHPPLSKNKLHTIDSPETLVTLQITDEHNPENQTPNKRQKTNF